MTMMGCRGERSLIEGGNWASTTATGGRVELAKPAALAVLRGSSQTQYHIRDGQKLFPATVIIEVGSTESKLGRHLKAVATAQPLRSPAPLVPTLPKVTYYFFLSFPYISSVRWPDFAPLPFLLDGRP